MACRCRWRLLFRRERMGVRYLAAAVLAGFLGSCSPSPVAAQTVDVAVVVNPNNPVTNVTTIELRKIFAGEKHSWPRGLPITLIVRSSGCHERLALLKLLGMSESEYKRYWAASVFRGDAPTE